jgi:mycothiol system anti-sigma-R factor
MSPMSEGRNIRCEEVVQQLLVYLDGEVEGERQALIGRHLEECRSCCSRLEFELALRSRVQDVGSQPASSGLRRRIARLIEEF